MQLTLENVIKHPSLMMYIWADDDAFLRKLDTKTATIISRKKSNQMQVMAVISGGYGDAFRANCEKVKNAFIDTYGMTPERALVTLANGGEVAGKNWAAGIYGIGKIRRSDFSQDTSIKVDMATGKIFVNGQEVNASVIYSKGKVAGYTYVKDGVSYTSQRVNGKYYAGMVTTADGNRFDASGSEITDADTSSIWEAVITLIDKLVNWFLSLVGKQDEAITPDKTFPSQADGFKYDEKEASFPWWLLALVGGGWLLKGGKFKGMKK